MWQWQKCVTSHSNSTPGLQHSLAIWHLRVGSLNWILIIHCTVWCHNDSKETRSAYTLKSAACTESQSAKEICYFFSKLSTTLLLMGREKKERDNKRKWLGLVISVLQRKRQLGDRCVNSPVILLNTNHTLVWVCSWKSFPNLSPKKKLSH